MKTLYLSQDKTTKDLIKNDFMNKEENQYINKRLNRLKIISLLGISFSVAIFVYDIISTVNWYEYISTISLLIASIYFLYKRNKLINIILNNYLLKNKTKYKNLKQANI